MIELSLYETRILGVLFEKERTTPDQYPLSLNSLTNGCNQKSNREPVLNLDESTVQSTLDSLIQKSLVSEVTLNGRIPKYRQRFGNTQFSEYDLSLKEHSLLSVLFLRGPQTPGELRTRSQRLCEFTDVQEVENVLEDLCKRSDPYVAKLAREPGKRESRYMHLFSGDDFSRADATETYNAPSEAPKHCEECMLRIEELETKIEQMQNAIKALQEQWDDLNGNG